MNRSLPTRWRVACLLFVGAAINYLDRAAISAVSPAIKQDLGISTQQMGLVFSSFFVGYAVMNFLGGWAADRYGAAKVFGIALVAWSLFCGFTVLAQGVVSLMVLRVAFGAAEGPLGSASATLIGRWFPKKEVSTAIAAVASGTPVGAIVAGPIIGLLLGEAGWRTALIAVSAVGLVFALVWAHGAPTLTGESAAPGVPSPNGGDGARGAVLRFFRHPRILANAFGYFAYTYLLAVFLSWLPMFLTIEHKLDPAHAAVSTSLPWVMAFVGILIGGLVIDRIYRVTGRLSFSRLIVQVGSLMVAGTGAALIGWVDSADAALGLAGFSLFALFLSGASYWAVVQDLVPSHAVGKISGFTHLIANIGGVVGPAVTGALAQHRGSFQQAWLLAGLIAVGAAACVAATARVNAREGGPAIGC